MKIDSKFIEHWEPKYDEIQSDEREYLSLIETVKNETKTLSSISLETFERIIHWKSPRVKGKINWANFDEYQEAIKKVLNKRYSDKMNLLIELPGIGAPVASTILNFIFPDVFPIYDFRTVEVLHSCAYLKNKTVSQKRYPEFQKVIQGIRTELAHYNLRQIDRALFAYHKINFIKVDKYPSSYKKNTSTKRCKSNHIAAQDIANKLVKRKLNDSIPEVIESICEELGVGGKVIKRRDILEKAEEKGINKASVLPADYCENTRTGKWSRYSFLHSIGPGRYILAKLKSKNKKY